MSAIEKRRVVLELDGRHTFLPEFLRFVAEHADGFNASLARELADQIDAQVAEVKPAEPLGLGAVVEDEDGQRWVRAGRSHDGRLMDNWRGVDGGDQGGWWAEWKNIAAVKVLNAGWSE